MATNKSSTSMHTTGLVPRRATNPLYNALACVLLLAACPLHAQTLTSEDNTPETADTKNSVPVSDDTSPVRFQLSGFGTLGLIYTDAKDLRFVRPSVNHFSRDNPDSGPDTVIGVQANLSLGQRAALVVQGISRKNTLNNYQPHATLAFVSYAIAPYLTVRAGRLRMPFFMLSDTLDINYANPWIRPSTEIYSLHPFNDLDGADILLSNNFGQWSVELRVFLGSSSADIYQGGKGRLTQKSEPAGVTASITNGKLTLFAAHGSGALSINWKDEGFQNLSSGLLAYDGLTGGNTGARILQDLSGDEGRGKVSSAAVQWDDTNHLFIAQYGRLTTTRYTPNAYAWDVTVGRRFGSLMPYFTYARHKANGKITSVTPTATGFPPFDEAIQKAIQDFTASRTLAQKRATLGLRWDFYRNTAFKLEYSRTHIDRNSWGSFSPTTIDLTNPPMGGRHVNTIGASIDVTF